MEVVLHVVVSIAELIVRRPRSSPNIDPTSVTTTTCRGNTALHMAAQYGSTVSTVEEILRLNQTLLFATNMRGDTALHVAARLGKSEIAGRLIDASGAERANFILTRNAKNSTAVHEAVRGGHCHVAKLLMERFGSLANFEGGEESLLFMALDGGHLRIAYHILETFPACSSFGSRGLTVMHAAVFRSSYVRFPEFSWGMGSYFAAFHLLVALLIRKESFHGFLKKLLELRGPEILEIADDIAWMPHHYAAAMGKQRILKLFLSTNKSLAYKQDNEGMSALHISARNGKVSVVRLLVEKCLDVCELLDKRDRTALHIAAQHKQVDVIRIFLRTATFTDLLNEQDNDGNTALHLAAISEHCESIILLARDRRLNMRLLNNMGMTAYDIINKSSVQLGIFEKAVITFNIVDRHGPLLSLQEFSARKANVAQPVQTNQAPNTTQPVGLNAPLVSSSKDEMALKNTSRKAHDQMADIILLVATIIAGVTFTAAITMPGGYNSSNGLAILRDVRNFRKFLVFDSLAFGCAAGTMLIHFVVSIHKKLRGEAYEYPFRFSMLLTILSITSTVLAFLMSTSAVLYEEKSLKSVWLFGLPGNIAFFAFIGTFIYFFVPLLLTTVYYTLLQVPDDYLPVPMAITSFTAFTNIYPRIMALIGRMIRAIL